jgi:transposase InsO family protein
MLGRLGMNHIHTFANHPSANGAVERLNQTIKRMLIAGHVDYPFKVGGQSAHAAACLHEETAFLLEQAMPL